MPHSLLQTAAYLRDEQYRDDANLSARVNLHQVFTTNRYGWQRWVFDHLNLPESAQVLELGCGPGNLWLENRDRVPHTWRITLTDFSPGMIRSAQQPLTSLLPQAVLQEADAQALPYVDEQFDAVVANHMLYHVPDRARAFSEIHRVLKPGGRIYAATNGASHMRELDALLERYVPDAEPGNTDVSFSLENGAEQLRPWFDEVQLRRYPDRLDVTEVAPVLAYIASTAAAAHLTAERREQIGHTVAGQIATHGSFQITKAVGMFTGRRNTQAAAPQVRLGCGG